MRRREFLLGGLALGSLMPALGEARAQGLPVSSHLPARIIDAHCHIFNADDVPIEGFMKRVVIPGNSDLNSYFGQYPDAFVVLIHALSKLLKDQAQSAAVEASVIDRIERRHAPAPSPASASAREIIVIKILLDQIWDKSALRELRWKKDAIAADVALRQLQRLMLLEVYPNFYCCGATPQDVDAISRQDLAERLHRSNQTIGRNLRWGLLFMRYRFELADQIHQLHHGRTVLVTPALVDFSKWVEDDNHTPFAQQVDVMERISRRGPSRTGAAVHGFVAFDPLRQALHDKGRESGIAPLELVKLAIEQKGFIGVKLYPPMGFRPANNAALGRAFPGHVLAGLGPNTGQILDDAMKTLFAWCHKNSVPVMAHTANSNAAGRDYGQRANPMHWEPVLKEFPNLRVNFAHFGGFREIGKDKRRENTWEWGLGKMWQKTPASFVFADISYLSEILSQKAKREAVLGYLKSLRGDFGESANHMIYGSDWAILGRERGIPPIDLSARRSYPDLIADYLSAGGFSDAQIDKIMFGNSVRFLGLGADQREAGTRGRLERFYESASLDKAWMTAFD